MLPRFKNRQLDQNAIPTTSLADMMFLLLIFFIMTTTLARVMTGGSAPSPARSAAVRTLIAFTMATAPIVSA